MSTGFARLWAAVKATLATRKRKMTVGAAAALVLVLALVFLLPGAPLGVPLSCEAETATAPSAGQQGQTRATDAQEQQSGTTVTQADTAVDQTQNTTTIHDESAPGHDVGQGKLTSMQLGPWETWIDYSLPVTEGTGDETKLLLNTMLGVRNISELPQQTSEADWILRDADGTEYPVSVWAAREVGPGETYYENVAFTVNKGAPNPFVLIFRPRDNGGGTQTEAVYQYPEELRTR